MLRMIICILCCWAFVGSSIAEAKKPCKEGEARCSKRRVWRCLSSGEWKRTKWRCRGCRHGKVRCKKGWVTHCKKGFWRRSKKRCRRCRRVGKRFCGVCTEVGCRGQMWVCGKNKMWKTLGGCDYCRRKGSFGCSLRKLYVCGKTHQWELTRRHCSVGERLRLGERSCSYQYKVMAVVKGIDKSTGKAAKLWVSTNRTCLRGPCYEGATKCSGGDFYVCHPRWGYWQKTNRPCE